MSLVQGCLEHRVSTRKFVGNAERHEGTDPVVLELVPVPCLEVSTTDELPITGLQGLRINVVDCQRRRIFREHVRYKSNTRPGSKAGGRESRGGHRRICRRGPGYASKMVSRPLPERLYLLLQLGKKYRARSRRANIQCAVSCHQGYISSSA
jgi:hypothetical protein